MQCNIRVHVSNHDLWFGGCHYIKINGSLNESLYKSPLKLESSKQKDSSVLRSTVYQRQKQTENSILH